MKKSIDDLAVFGGTPLFQEKLHVGRPNIGSREVFLARVNEILDRKWLTNYGPFVQEFEKRIAEYVGVKHCIAMCNGTIAMEIAIRALGLSGEVIIPSFTFIATAHALQWQEITPVFCDIHPGTFTIDPESVEKMITPRTTGIIGVHIWGKLCETDRLAEIARENGLKLMFDAAHAFGCSSGGKMAGNFGDVEIFSFHATKYFNTFEGGAVVTNDDRLATKIRLMKNFGFSGYDNVIYIGSNGKMNEISAAMGLTNFDSLEDFLECNRSNYRSYQSEIRDIPGVTMLSFDDQEKSNYQYIVVLVDEERARIGRDDLIDILHAENILARRYFYPGCHRMEPYVSFFPHSYLLLPETEKMAKRVLLLPTGVSIGEKETMEICNLLRFLVGNAGEVAGRKKEWKHEYAR